ncbi:hypothetical protein N0V88_007115 [Collariella sp. IMI 366227]|nr:hypothetical protein N0V88_007115 [Collariella sp. IMI 366227]
MGLQTRGVSFTVYERAPYLREIGAGIGFSPNAEYAMGLLSPDAVAGWQAVANHNGEDYFQWINGYDSEQLIFKLHVGDDRFQGCRRSDILEQWESRVLNRNPACILYNKDLDTIFPSHPSGKLVLRFKDHTIALADAIIGCDGIHSRALSSLGPYPCSTCFMYLGPNAHIITYPVASNTLLNILAVVTDPKGVWPAGASHIARASKGRWLKL